MTVERDAPLMRRYLLGGATEEQAASLEQAYFEDTAALEALEAGEESLIEDYLAGRLTPAERDQFDQHYLAAPHRRIRVETSRRLAGAASRSQPVAAVALSRPSRRWHSRAALAIAAGVLLAVAGGVWLAKPWERTPIPTPAPASLTPSVARTSHNLAWEMSPVAVRGAGDTPPLVIPSDVDLLDLRLEGDANRPLLGPGRVTIRSVAGNPVWQGPAITAPDLPAGILARAEVPAGRLRADDYIVTLFETRATGADTERLRYFLRVRAR